MSTPVTELGYQVATSPKANLWWSALDDEETPELVWPCSVAVYDKMGDQDTQVASMLNAVTHPVRQTRWWINPAGARDEVVEHVANDLGLPIKGADPTPPPRRRDRFSWKEHLRLALLMIQFGHSFFEQKYRIDTTRPGGTHLAKLGWRPPRTISGIDVASDGGLVAIRQPKLNGFGDLVIGVERLVAYVNDRRGGRWQGRSVLRGAYKHWLLKDRMLRVGSQAVERNGMGVPVYTQGESEARTDPEKTHGLKIATDVRSGETAGAALPHDAKLELLAVRGTIPDALPWIRYHDDAIARAFLAHFLNLGQQTGSWALGTTFLDFFTLSENTLAGEVADVATMHVVEDLVDVNWGPEEPAPVVEFQQIGQQQTLTAQAIKMLLDSGALRHDPALEQALRQQYGLPPAEPVSRETMPPPLPPAFPTEDPDAQ